MPAAFVVGLQQQTQELVDGAMSARDVARNRRRDAMPVLGGALPVRSRYDRAAPCGEARVTTAGVAAGEVTEQDEIGSRTGK
ncbi:hypothetical protein [Actinacidiphila alni]|uniref:hypothetical protein n=1 Tax=Actinacidiphila alni TaxID=380248 RepID=UPI0015A71D98|nr:hypothetical protein [Actinacidiphila alni]